MVTAYQSWAKRAPSPSPPGSSAVRTIFVAEDGDDTAAGFSSSPVATVAQAIRMAAPNGIVSRETTILLRPRTDGQRYTLPPMKFVQLLAPLQIVGDLVNGVNELIPSTAAAAASSDIVVTSAGLVVNAFRGKTIEILSGAAAGDRRTIRDNTATDIVPVARFSAAVAPGDLYRVFEPTVDVLVDTVNADDAWIINAAPGAVPLVSVADTQIPLFYLVNLNLDLDGSSDKPWMFVDSTVAMFGVELTGVGFGAGSLASPEYRGALLMGVDSAGLSGAVRSAAAHVGVRFGAPTTNSWVGWGLADPTVGDFPTWRTVRVHGFIVIDRFPCFGIRGHLIGGNFFAGGIRLQDAQENPDTHLHIRGNDNPDLNFLITGTTWGIDASFFGTTGPNRKLFCSQVTVVATAGPAVFLSGPGYIVLRSNENVINGSTDAVVVEMGGRIEVDTTGSFTAGTGDELVVQDGAGGNAAVSTVAALAARGDHITFTDGSIIQRINA